MSEKLLYRKYSDYLKEKYGVKVYKLPVNLPVSCPNRDKGQGCSFCAPKGTGFEALPDTFSVTKQLSATKELIEEKYKAQKFIAYFQNYTNTYLPLSEFGAYMSEAAALPYVVEIDVSTRPDCIRADYLKVLKEIEEKYSVSITVELGLQTVNYHTLDEIGRGHGLAEFIDAVLEIKKYGFSVCTHVILNLPGDELIDAIETAKVLSALEVDLVKLHSLYIAKGTKMCRQYESGKLSICSKDTYMNRVIHFLECLSPNIVVERLFSRIPKDDCVFSNWNTSWWKLQDELLQRMAQQDSYQGKNYNYLGGSALNGF